MNDFGPLLPKFIDLVIGLACSYLLYLLGCWLDPIVQRKRRKIKINKLLKRASETEDPNYHVLISNNNLYHIGFPIIQSSQSYIYRIPDKDGRERLLNEDFHFGERQVTDKNSNRYTNQVKKLINTNIKEYIPDADAFIENTAVETADRFILDLKASKLRFNKSLFGVFGINKEEKEIQVYTSDYFTFKFTVQLYNKLNEISRMTPLNELPCFDRDKNIDIKPFLNSIGVGGFLVVDRGKGDELVFGWRDKRSCESGGYWHFTYDETFTPDDVNNDGDGSNDLITCLKRALYEEIGINYDQQKICMHPKHMGVIDAGIICTGGEDKRFEFEVCTFARLCFSASFTIDDFVSSYQFAKDAAIETSNLRFVPIRELGDFLLDESNAFSPEARHLCAQLKIRIEEGIIPSDVECYRDIMGNEK